MHRLGSERDRRIDRLVDGLGLLGVCERACAVARIPEQVPALAYCLVTIADKDARPGRAERERPIEVDAPEAGEQLAHWAAAVATNLKDWQAAYTAIQEEFVDYGIKTLRKFLLPYLRAEQGDVLETIADRIAEIIDDAPSIDEMTLDAARANPAPGNAYVFRHPLPWWIGAVAKSRRPRDTLPWTPGGPEPEGEAPRGDREADDVLVVEIAVERARRDDALAALIDQIVALRATRGLLAEALDFADRWDRRLAATTPADHVEAAALVRVRASMLYEADLLALERRSMTGMLAYVLLAMRAAPRLQHVAVLSLRDVAIDEGAVEEIAARMSALLDDARHPSLLLLDRTRAAPRPPVPASRGDALARLRDRPARRDRDLTSVAEMLRALPTTVAGLEEIERITRGSTTAVTTYRRDASRELHAIDASYDRVFRRYAMGPRA